MTTQDDDDTPRLEPPQGQPQPAQGRPQPPQVQAPGQVPATPEPGGELQPGAGKPMVEGPPMSVSEPASDTAINRTAGIFGIGLLGVAAIVTVLVLVLIVLAICTHL